MISLGVKLVRGGHWVERERAGERARGLKRGGDGNFGYWSDRVSATEENDLPGEETLAASEFCA